MYQMIMVYVRLWSILCVLGLEVGYSYGGFADAHKTIGPAVVGVF